MNNNPAFVALAIATVVYAVVLLLIAQLLGALVAR